MGVRVISEIAINSAGHLLVKPAAPSQSDSMIYRSGAGVQWDPGALAFVAAEPQRWAPVELARQIARAVREELGDELRLGATTQWNGVSSQLQGDLANEFEGAADV